MITNPKHGWCNFKLRTFEGTPSYLTDVPIDLLNAFIDYHVKGSGIVWLDEEGTEFSLVITPYSLFIIEEKDKPILHDFSEMKIDNMEKELIKDIATGFDGRANIITDDDPEELTIHRDEINQKLTKKKKQKR